MKKNIFIVFIQFSLISIFANAQVNFDFNNGEKVEFSQEEVQLIVAENKPSQSGFRASPDVFNMLPNILQKKLLLANQNDLYFSNNTEYSDFLNFMGLTASQATELRHLFIDSTAKSIIQYLQKNPDDQVRVLARDLNEVYSQVELLLSPKNTSLSLNVREKIKILERVALVPASRPIVDSILKGPNPKVEIFALFQVNEVLFKKGNVLFLDSGFEGSIAIKLYDTFKSYINEGKLKWSFSWKAAVAPNYISRFQNPDFEKSLEDRDLLEKFTVAHKPYSFRIALMEHFPKWTGRALSWKTEPVVIMLDLDDTILKEVDIEKFKDSPRVQLIKYIPGPGTAKKYHDRLADPQRDKSKVIHYEFNGEEMTGSVTVRPTVENFISSLEPLIQQGKVKLLVTSNNDPSRTQAMIQQLKIKNKTLQEIGAIYVESKLFNTPTFQKDMGMLRKNLNIQNESTIIAIDDLPNNYVRSNALDTIEAVTPFSGERAINALKNEMQQIDLQDQIQFGRLYESILRATINTEAQSDSGRVRATYLSQGQEHFTLMRSPRKATNSCHALFLKGDL